jgi:hypothetical protein
MYEVMFIDKRDSYYLNGLEKIYYGDRNWGQKEVKRILLKYKHGSDTSKINNILQLCGADKISFIDEFDSVAFNCDFIQFNLIITKLKTTTEIISINAK